jgi:hypothetical protein
MTNKLFIYAANEILDWCIINGTNDYTECPNFFFCENMFLLCTEDFNSNSFIKYIETNLIS